MEQIEQHEIKPGYTRVSEVISKYTKYDQVPRYILDNACARGTMVHDHIEGIIQGFCAEPDAGIAGYIQSFNLWYKEYYAYASEMPNRWYDDQNLLTGKCDFIMREGSRKEKITLVDFKTSYSASKTWMLQAGGYVHLARQNGINITDITFLHLKKGGCEPVEIRYDVETSLEWFLAALKLHRFLM